VSELITRTARLTPYSKRPRQASGFVTAYSYEPAPAEKSAELGNLLIVIEVLSSGRMAEEVVDIVIETAGQHYYNHEVVPTMTLLHRFEQAIKAVNSELSQYIERGNATWVGKLSAIIAIQANDELHLAQTGSAEAFLARGRASTRITASATPRGAQANKTFGAITSGTLESGDRLLLATPALIHQLPLARLRTLMASSAPAGIIAEISSLLEGTTSADRIAALAVEVATPEQAALQLLSDQPSDVVLMSDESPLNVAKQAALPLAHSAVSSGRKLSESTARNLERAKPHANRSVNTVRVLAHRILGSRRALIGSGILFALILFILTLTISNARMTAQITRLQNQFVSDSREVQQLIPRLSGTQKDGAEEQLSSIQTDLSLLAKTKDLSALNKRLAKSDLPTGSPRSVSGLQQQISQLLDQAENVQRLTPIIVASITSKSNEHNYIELVSGQLIIVSASGNNITLVDPKTNLVTTSKADSSQLGSIRAITSTAAGDGIYILTQTPAVWLYKPGGDSLTKQNIGTGAWPVSSSIASYNGNLYLLGVDGSVYRSLRTLSGFGPTVATLTPAHFPELTGARALAVDGAIYVISDKGLLRYLSGVLQQSVVIPSGLAHAETIRSIGDGSTLLLTDSTSNRIGTFRLNGKTLSYSRQFIVNGTKVTDATYDDTTNSIYAIAGNNVVSFTLK
jgi:hypothetical protein